jgi:hypothetical protein
MGKQPKKSRTCGRPASRHGAVRANLESGYHIGRITYGPPLGEGVVQAPLEEVLAALESNAALDWSSAAEQVLPVLPRLRPYPPGSPKPLVTMLPPGVATGFGIDVGPAFMNVTPELATSWRIGVADIATRAVANVHDRAGAVRASDIHVGNLAGARTEWLQTGRSIGSTLIFAPHHLRRIFGPEPRVFITPMRDLIIGLPGDVDSELALWLHAEIASEDPNCLGPTGYSFDGSGIRPFQLDVESPLPVAERPFLVA